MQSPYHPGYIYPNNYQAQLFHDPRSPQHYQNYQNYQNYQRYQYNSPGFYPIMSNEEGSGSASQPQEESPGSNEGSQPKEPAKFYCFYSPCASEGKFFGRKADLERHFAAKHIRSSQPMVDCEYEGKDGCHRRGEYGFVRRDKMIEHMRDVHKVDIPKRQPGKRSPS